MDREANTINNILESMLLDESTEPTQLPLSLLEVITNHFSLDHQIGKGGFAVVYKGIVGKGMVAVKKLSDTFRIPENKFHEEVRCLINARHKNIVRFLGYCAETQGKMEKYEGKLVMADQRNWLLCFEYVCNGSLDKHITDASFGLNWRVRYQIIRGIAEGLLFLHEKRILHLDLKPANILLDPQMVPKICDFGLSKCLGEEQTRAITKSRSGTLGYMDPEYLRSGRITFASDIYSLGVIILEILTGVKWYIEEDTVVKTWMNRLEASERDLQLEQVRVCIRIGEDCMNLDPKKRPAAHHIIDRLDKTTSADYSYEIGTSSSLAQLHESLPREQSGERIGKLAAESLDSIDVEKDCEILNDSFWGAQDMKQKADGHGVSAFSSISTVFNKLNNLNIFNRKSCMGLSRNDIRCIEKSDNMKIFKKSKLKPILHATNLIGRGSLSEVYKGVVDNIQVALKVMIVGSATRHKLFPVGVLIQSQAIHKNIVRLIGCCLEMRNPIFVYEFIPRGSFDEILHGHNKVSLSLDVRLTIVAESAEGLAYVHSQARTELFHGDLKPKSILLDHNLKPKITGFGEFMVLEIETTVFTTDIDGINHTDPVWFRTGVPTQKSDVYSFGVVILEIISRKKPGYSLVCSFLEVHEKGKKATDLFDKEIAVTRKDLEILDCLAEIAVECLELDVDERPTMSDVAERLLTLQRYHRSQVTSPMS